MLTKANFYLTIGVLFSFATTIAIEEIRISAAKEDLANLNAEYSSYKAEAEKLQRDELAKAASETERRLKNQETIINEREKTIEKLRSDYRNASATSQRLRDHIKKLTTASNGSTTTNPTTTSRSKAEITAERLGELASLADETAGKLARELDDAIARGRACEILYQSLNEGSVNGSERVN